MSDLPSAPASLVYCDVRIQFSAMTDGDSGRGFVPGYHFRILNSDGGDVGHLNFRVGESDHVKLAAGHIGFEISPEHRGNRYAGDACLALAEWAFTISESILITVDPDNLPSRRTIERIGAQFLDEVDVPLGDPHYLKGSLRKRLYLWTPSHTAILDSTMERLF